MTATVRTAGALARASHLVPSLAVTAFAAAYAAGAGAGAGLTTRVATAVLAGQLCVGWSNDWVDAQRDLAVGRRDKPVVVGTLDVRTLRAAALVGVGACVVLSAFLGAGAAVAHLLAVASAWAYNLRLKATALSWLPYALSFGLLPSVVTLALPSAAWAPARTTAAAALLGVGAHLANALPDLDDDAATGVVGLPLRLGRRRTTIASIVALVGATVLVASGAQGLPTALALVATGAAAGLGASAAIVAVRAPTSRWPFGASIAVSALVVLLLVAG